MKEVVELIKLWEPEKAKLIEGIDNFFIENVEKFDNIKFPPSYLRFAKTMISNLGPLSIDNDENILTIDEVRTGFRRHIGAPRYFIFSNHYPKDEITDISPYFIDLKDPYGEDFAVVRMPKDAAWNSEFHYARKEFVSLREMLIYWAYWSVRVPQFKYSAFIMEKLTDDEEFYDIEMFDLIANSFDLTLCPYLDFWRYYDGNEASFCVKRDMETHQITDVDVFSNDKLLLAKIVETILDNTPLVEVEETD